MQLLKNFTIRRVVLWILIAVLSLMALAAGYGTLILREIYHQADRKIRRATARISQPGQAAK